MAPSHRAPVDRAVLLLAAAVTGGYLLTAGGYGVFRDELYYLACADHLAWGYVDHPPMVAVVAWAIRHTLGTSLIALRMLPALAAGGLVLLAAEIARGLGGSRFARLLTSLTAALAPVYLSLLSILSMNALDLVVWSALLLLLVRILGGGRQRLWVPFGVLAGVGLLNKISVAFLGAGLLVGLIGARRWRELRSIHFWVGGAVAVVLFAPHVVWQITHDWPTLEFIRRATETKNVDFAPMAYVAEQIRMMNPLTLPIWLSGLAALLFSGRFRDFRALGIAYLAILLLFLTENSKPYYLAPIYPVLFAAGAVVVERATDAPRWRPVRAVVVAVVLLSGAALAPLARPLLTEDHYVAYAEALGVAPGSDERHALGRLPQFFADMHGWPELAATVATVHAALPPEDRARACVFAQNYGQAGAVDLFGPELGLPAAISGHNSYWLWGPGRCTGDVVIIIGGVLNDHAQAFEDVTPAATFHCRDCMPYENDQTIWVARGLRAPISDAWSSVKHFD